MARRGAPELSGILNINKPRGWTSHDVVARVRRVLNMKRIGHAGTLDPLAEGVLPILVGRATRLADLVQTGTKTYRATVALGTATETDDAEGTVIATAPVPELCPTRLSEALAAFVGQILQVPPRYSALKLAGQRAYAVARRGEDVQLAARPVTIHAIDMVSRSDTTLVLDVTCSKGTYIRSLARDLAVKLGTVGHLAGLVRTRVGPFALSDALTLDRLEARGATAVLPASAALPEAPTYAASIDEAARLANGRAIPVAGLHATSIWVYDPGGHLGWLGAADGLLLRPRVTL